MVVKRFIFIALVFLVFLSDLKIESFVKSIFFTSVSFWIYVRFFRLSSKDPDIRFSLGIFTYLPWLLKEIFVSTISLVNIVIFSKSKNIRPVINSIKTNMRSDTENVIYGNSITITPGTLTMKIDDNSLKIHSISKMHYKGLIEGKMASKIKESQK